MFLRFHFVNAQDQAPLPCIETVEDAIRIDALIFAAERITQAIKEYVFADTMLSREQYAAVDFAIRETSLECEHLEDAIAHVFIRDQARRQIKERPNVGSIAAIAGRYSGKHIPK